MFRDVHGLFLRPDSGAEGGAATEPGVIDTTAGGAIDLAAVRNLILLAHPDVIPELVAGANFDEMLGSVESARAAYQRVAESVQSAATNAPAEVAAAPKVPAGGGQRQMAINIDQLSPAAKISEGLRRRHNRGS
jgi:hypothetical protein